MSMFINYDKKVWQALVAGATVSGVSGASTNGNFRWDSNSTIAYPANDATSGALIQQIMYDPPTNQTYILYMVST